MSRIAYTTPSPVELDTRRAFTKTQRLQILLASDGRCARCGVKLGAKWECDHVLAWNQGGRTDVGNGEALCGPCHSPKTGKDTTRAAKTKRQAKMLEPREASKRPIRSAGFSKTHTRRFDGSVVRRFADQGRDQ